MLVPRSGQCRLSGGNQLGPGLPKYVRCHSGPTGRLPKCLYSGMITHFKVVDRKHPFTIVHFFTCVLFAIIAGFSRYHPLHPLGSHLCGNNRLRSPDARDQIEG